MCYNITHFIPGESVHVYTGRHCTSVTREPDAHVGTQAQTVFQDARLVLAEDAKTSIKWEMHVFHL